MSPSRLLIALAAACSTAAHAGSDSSRFCDRSVPLSAAAQDRLLRFGAIVRDELIAGGAGAALISRSGLDLSRFDIRYSHAGIALKPDGDSPWSVRQLYYACDEARPRLFDQGVAGFVMGTDDPAIGYLSIVRLPREAALLLQAAALDRPRALHLVAPRYSANAYPFSLAYQNCNQWVIELMAVALGGLPDAPDLRARAQAWLAAAGYAPAPVAVGSHGLMFAAAFIPWIHLDDHPEDDRFALRLRLSLPASLEAFVRARLPEASRVELCHDGRRVVVHHGWGSIAEGCVPGAGDRVVMLSGNRHSDADRDAR